MKDNHFCLSRWLLLAYVALCGVLLSACSLPASVTSTPTIATAPTIVPVTPAPTMPPERTLVVCLGDEPTSLYPYSPATLSKRAILEAIYDGPIDYRSYLYQPVILQKIPSLSDGDVVLQPVSVKTGDLIIDSEGNLVNLAAGVKVRPSGCQQGDCIINYDGVSPLQMDQMVVTFKMLPDLKWSDGEPLTSKDSLYSYNLAADPDTSVNRYRIDRTASYEALDEITIRWTGVTGFLDANYVNNFWTPYPEHLWGKQSAAELPEAEIAAFNPIGWGPYKIQEWVKGDHIRLQKNPLYFRASEGLPAFENLVFRFVGKNASQNLTTLLTGECDVLDQSTGLEEQNKLLLELQQNGKLLAHFSPDNTWEHVDFGIKPASYDDGYNIASGDRPDIFGDVRTRQAFAYCMDRQSVVDQVLFGQTKISNTFLSPDHPLYNTAAKQYPFSVEEGAKLLDEVGWKDADNDPTTERTASGIPNIPDGTRLEVNYWTTQAIQRQQSSAILAQSLAKCGIKVNLQYYSTSDLFAEGPDGLFFGRRFDLVQYTWDNLYIWEKPTCSIYQSTNIPDQNNRWNGVNVSGYTNTTYDMACQTAGENLPDQTAYQENIRLTQEMFANDLPGIPLYMRVGVAATRPDFCGFKLDPTALSDMWNLEAFDFGNTCK